MDPLTVTVVTDSYCKLMVEPVRVSNQYAKLPIMIIICCHYYKALYAFIFSLPILFLFLVDPDRECLDADMCEQFCVRNNVTGVENCSCSSGFVLASNGENCTSQLA